MHEGDKDGFTRQRERSRRMMNITREHITILLVIIGMNDCSFLPSSKQMEHSFSFVTHRAANRSWGSSSVAMGDAGWPVPNNLNFVVKNDTKRGMRCTYPLDRIPRQEELVRQNAAEANCPNQALVGSCYLDPMDHLDYACHRPNMARQIWRRNV